MKLDVQSFKEDGRGYVVYQNLEFGTKNNCSCIIIDDEPGAYHGFVKDLVECEVCRLAAVLPFSDQSLALLNGIKTVFGNDITLEIPSMSRCVAVLDIRNESRSTFDGEVDKANSGVYFHRRLTKQVVSFFVTRYGVDRFRDSGLNGVYGFVDLEGYKSGEGKTFDLNKKGRRILLSAVNLGLQDLCRRTPSLVTVWNNIVFFSFRGWDLPFKRGKPMDALVEVLRNGNSDLHTNQLLININSRAAVFANPEADGNNAGKTRATPPDKENSSDPDLAQGSSFEDFSSDMEEETQSIDRNELGKDGSFSTSQANVSDVYTLDELKSMRDVVSCYRSQLDEMKVLKQQIALVRQEYPAFDELYNIVEGNSDLPEEDRIDISSFEDNLAARFAGSGMTEDESSDLAELIIQGIESKEKLTGLLNSEFVDVKEEALKRYRNILYKWHRAGYPKELIIYRDPTCTETARKNINRALHMIKQSGAPLEFYRHLRDNITIDSSCCRYTGGEDWSFYEI